ncbi:eukaryotic translation initiation factor 3 subunit E [Tuber magnatum]|uniref:Eukaryotic translation initiation factor 3 subunit E n=1 Tax=Tuber magnatum TaxID=42249 RepID=A0A317SNB3_9PEZI|nr:eukaryotic translation initiation factor 3 subunit E [Tuber magnatum]
MAASYDLIPKLLPHLDRHMIFPLLGFMGEQGRLTDQELAQARYDLLKNSNMTDFICDLYKEIHSTDEVPDELNKRQEVVEKLHGLGEKSELVLNLLGNSEVLSNLRADKLQNLQYLQEKHDVTVEMVNVLYDYGQHQYSCGNYGEASDILYRFRVLSTDNEKTTQATWGKLACDILSANWEGSMEEITKVKDLIEQKLYNNPLGQLQARTWLVHWTLFPFFNYTNYADAREFKDPKDSKEPKDPKDVLLELFFSPAFINTIQTSCPWILRYVAAAVTTNRNRKNNSGQYQKQLKDLVRIIKQELYEYHDPITDFVAALYVDFDFEEAQRKLSEAEEVLKSDFFLASSAASFVDSARHLISESYCKIHQRIDIKDLAQRLNLTQDEGEKWIVNLIRDTRVDAKIDYKDGTVIMNHPPQSVYQQVIEKTKGGLFRTQVLTAAVSK